MADIDATGRPSTRWRAHAQVSRQTVSNALNAPHLLHPDTLSRVQAAIEALGYRPSRAARQLRTSRSQLIGVRPRSRSGDGVNGYVLDRFLHGLTEAARPAGYHVLLFSAGGDEHEIEAYDDLLATHELDAFVLTSTHHGDPRTAWLAERDVPFVTFGRPWGSRARHSWVDVDGAAGTREVDRATWSPPVTAASPSSAGRTGSGVGDDRRAGWEPAMAEAGLSHRRPGASAPTTAWTPGARAASGCSPPPSHRPRSSAPATRSPWACRTRRARLQRRDGRRRSSASTTPRSQRPSGSAQLGQPLTEAASVCLRLLVDLLEPRPGPSAAEARAARPAPGRPLHRRRTDHP